jgi:hypothetical protein
MRSEGREALGTVLNKPTNIKILETAVFKISKQLSRNKNELARLYKQYIFQVIGDVINKKQIKYILGTIQKHNIGWDHSNFESAKSWIKEHDDFIVNPFEVEEGVLECRCGSKRVFSYSKQVRSGDESTTVFAQCMACDSKWVVSS